MTTKRISVAESAPAVFTAMLALHAAARNGLDPLLAELVLIRSSQINRCGYCLDMHTTDARKAGETEERMHMLPAFEGAGLYSEKEKAGLALTEAITTLADGVPDDVYDRAAAHFEDAELAQLISLATTINAWNRINVATHAAPGAE